MRAARGRLPLQFEANLGQVDPAVRYVTHGRHFSLFLTSTDAVFVFGTAPNALRMRLEAANAHSRIAGVEELPGKVNYFIGSDRQKWRTGVATFGKVRYEDIYPGIDLVYRGNGSELEYDFVVSPGADPRAIALHFSGAEALCVDRDGNLVLDRGDGQLRMHRPLVYQDVDDRRVEIAGEFRIIGQNEVGFSLGRYDESRGLIVDPSLEYSTYLGGTGFDQAQAIALDGAGNAYVTGFTSSEDFPLVNPYQTVRGPGQAVFVSKLDASGTVLIYSTFLGGNDNNAGLGIAVDAAGEAVVVGQTSASDFPTVNAVQPTYGGVQDAFVTKLSADGASLVYSTYLGGAGGDGANAVAVDSAGNAYVAGGSNGTDFPTLNPIHVPTESTLPDAVVSKLSPSGSLVYSTYLGGSLGDSALGIAVDPTGAAYVGGQTESTDFPVTAGVFQSSFAGGGLAGFVLKLNPAGTGIVYSTYVGGSLFDEVNAVAVTAGGEAWVTGVTLSSQFPTLNPLQAASTGLPDAFVTKLSTTGAGLFSTYLGGSALDSGIGIGLDAAGNAYVTGVVDSADFPVVNALQPTLGGPEDAYVTEISSTGSHFVYSTFLGGSSDDEGIALAVDAAGRAVVTGRTNSNDFPTLNPAQAGNAGGFGDAFVTRISAAPNITDLDLFLRLAGHPPATDLLGTPPDTMGYTFRDSGVVKFAGGNPWATVASWKASPTPAGTLSSLGPLKAWIGLKNAADAGANFDVRAQVFHNGVLVSEGMTRCVQNLGHPPGSIEVAVPIDSFAPVPLAVSDDLTLTIAARIGTDSGDEPCGGPQSAKGVRVYFDSAAQPSTLTLGLAP
ncbi:MAG TPA: SBBP repeat-containing protein [Thermoanaerobaculia bacterium]|nr:SBBP repeat-containing protein [Thermoanaerobaculia bacterium]